MFILQELLFLRNSVSQLEAMRENLAQELAERKSTTKDFELEIFRLKAKIEEQVCLCVCICVYAYVCTYIHILK
jgi:hypothetical protein